MATIRDPAEGARALESMLLKQLISDSGMFRGMNQAGGKIYGEMFCEALANAVARSGGVGIAKLVEESFGPTADEPATFLFDRSATPVKGTTGTEGGDTDVSGVSSNYGRRVDPLDGTERFHTGIDIAAKEGSAIFAAAAGTVRKAGWRGGYGKSVEIDNGAGVSTLYGHASALSVKVGDQVNAGDPIGFVGQTGRATGPHLHFEVRKDGKPTDPQSTLNRWKERADVLVGRKPY